MSMKTLETLAVFSVALSVPFTAFASKTTGEIALVAWHTNRGESTFSFGLSSTISDRPHCNTTGTYTIRQHLSGAIAAISLIINVRNGTVGGWKHAPVFFISGTGECTFAADSEDIKSVVIEDGDLTAFLLPKLDPLSNSHLVPPVIRNMSSTNRSHALKATVVQFKSDFCTLNSFDAMKKWSTANSRLANAFQEGLLSVSGVKTLLNGLGSLQCMGRDALHANGMTAYFENVVNGSAATALWRDDSGTFHGLALFKENGQWKIDMNNMVD